MLTIKVGKPGSPGWAKKTISLPSAWNEVPPKHFMQMGGIMLNTPTAAARMKLLGILLPKKTLAKMTSWQLVDIASHLDWAWEPVGETRPFKSVKCEGVDYYLPADGLKYITLIEYAFADFAFIQYQAAREAGKEDRAKEMLHKLIAYLARPMDPTANANDATSWKGDGREMFNTIICENRMHVFYNLPTAYKLAILMFFSSCKKAIHKRYKGSIFMDEKVNGIEINGVRKMQPHEWINLSFALAGGKFGTLQETMYTQLGLVLHELSNR